MLPFKINLFKKALYRAQHRGGKEADFLFGGFVETLGPSFNEAELEELNFILEHDDSHIFEWLRSPHSCPFKHQTKVLGMMKAYLDNKLS